MWRLTLFCLVLLALVPCGQALADAGTPALAVLETAPPSEAPESAPLGVSAPEGGPVAASTEVPDFLEPTRNACSSTYLCHTDLDCMNQCYAGCGLNGFCNTSTCYCTCTDQW